ncbi:MAG: MFS transporter [Nocardia sp.]|nr:MFS transporter [Nocardia sp.]
MAALTAVLFVTFLDTTVVSVALGDIRNELSTDVVLLQWVVNAYTLVFAGLMLAGGSFGDRWGRKKVMIIGLAIFCAGSVVAATTTTVAALILGRAIMGLGAAASEPGTLSLLRHIYPDARKRARAVGVWAATSGLALAAGPVLGGVLVDHYGWRSIFWFNLVIGAVALVVALVSVPESSDPRDEPIDWGGIALGAIFFGAIIYGATAGEHGGYAQPLVIGAFVLGAVAGIGFAAVEFKVRAPVLDFRYLRLPSVRSALVVAFGVYFGVFSIFFCTALYLQVVHDYTAWDTATVFTPMAVAIIVGSLGAGVWVSRRGAFVPMITGCVLASAGIALTRLSLADSVQDRPLSAVMAIAGLGFGIAVVPLTSAVLSGVPAAHSGMAAAVTNTMRQVGAATGVAILGALVNSLLNSELKTKMNAAGLPPELQANAIEAAQQGHLPKGVPIGPYVKYLSKVHQLIDGAKISLHHGLNLALTVSAILIALAAIFTVVDAAMSRRSHPLADSALADTDDQRKEPA